jgi:hypothetical protein
MKDAYIQALEDTTVELHKKMLQVEQILVLLVKCGAINRGALTLGQNTCIDRFLSEWMEEWKSDEDKH